jgi:hypothetical protein
VTYQLLAELDGGILLLASLASSSKPATGLARMPVVAACWSWSAVAALPDCGSQDADADTQSLG